MPISGSMLGCWIEVRMPAAPARAEPSPKVKEITTSVFTPIREAARGLKESARMAMPRRVCRTTVRSAIRRKIVTPSTSTCPTVMVSMERGPQDAGISSARSVMISGNDFGSRAEEILSGIFQKERNADRGDEDGRAGAGPATDGSRAFR